jgi:hypothetical protein
MRCLIRGSGALPERKTGQLDLLFADTITPHLAKACIVAAKADHRT